MKPISMTMLLACVALPAIVFSQTEGDALRYSSSTFGTTARSLSMGGAFGALGADFSSLSINPAGLMMYRRSELSFTPQVEIRNVDTKYNDNAATDSRFYFNMGNAGLVFAGQRAGKHDWKGWNWGFGYNRENSYRRNVSINGFNPHNSMTQAFSEEAQGVPYKDFTDLTYAFDVGLAWNVYLLNPAPTGPTDYQPAIPYGGVTQLKTSDIRGNKGSTIMSFGNNYKDKVFLAATMEFATFRHEEDNVYTEVDSKDSIISPYNQMDITSWNYIQSKFTIGRGFIGKFGVIVKPNDFFRIGAAIHTPGWYNVNYNDRYDMTATFGKDSTLVQPNGPVTSTFYYDLTTPFKAVGSIAFVIGDFGLLSADYEYVDYPMTKMHSYDYNFYNENANLKNVTHGASNIRVGGELKWEIFSFRAGAAFYSSPFKSKFVDDKFNFSTVSYTAGLGLRDKVFFMDLGYAYTQSKESYQLYQLQEETVPSVKQITSTHRIMLTMGWKF